MTQKELLYVEDAINHERNIIGYLETSLESLEEQEAIDFFQEEVDKHIEREEKLTTLLEDLKNEWSIILW